MLKSLATMAASKAKAAGKAAADQAKEQAKAAVTEAVNSAKEQATAAAKNAVESAKKEAEEAVTSAVNAQLEKVKNVAANSGVPVKNTTRKNNKNGNAAAVNAANATRKNNGAKGNNLGNNTYAAPGNPFNNNNAKPANGNSAAKPANGNSAAKPVNGNSAAKPVNGNSAAKPVNGKSAEAEVPTVEEVPTEEAPEEEVSAEEVSAEEAPAEEAPAEEASAEETPAEAEEETKPSTNSLPVAAPGAAPFSILLDNLQRYEPVWKDCHATLSKFQQILTANPATDGKLVKIESDSAAAGKYALKTTTKLLEGGLDKIGACKLLNFFVYYEFIKSLKESGNAANNSDAKSVEFFNKIEARREYHSRICITLCSMKDEDLKVPSEGANGKKDLDILTLDINSFDTLERIVYEANREDKEEKPVFTAYEKAYLVNQHMTMLAEWELSGKDGAEELGDKIYTAKRLAVIKAEGGPADLPSHLTLLAKYAEGDAEKIKKHYPQSLVMNYSYFYPFVLYWTGKAPDAPAA